MYSSYIFFKFQHTLKCYKTIYSRIPQKYLLPQFQLVSDILNYSIQLHSIPFYLSEEFHNKFIT